MRKIALFVRLNTMTIVYLRGKVNALLSDECGIIHCPQKVTITPHSSGEFHFEKHTLRRRQRSGGKRKYHPKGLEAAVFFLVSIDPKGLQTQRVSGVSSCFHIKVQTKGQAETP